MPIDLHRLPSSSLGGIPRQTFKMQLTRAPVSWACADVHLTVLTRRTPSPFPTNLGAVARAIIPLPSARGGARLWRRRVAGPRCGRRLRRDVVHFDLGLRCPMSCASQLPERVNTFALVLIASAAWSRHRAWWLAGHETAGGRGLMPADYLARLSDQQKLSRCRQAGCVLLLQLLKVVDDDYASNRNKASLSACNKYDYYVKLSMLGPEASSWACAR
jgi:hypothetical protein